MALWHDPRFLDLLENKDLFRVARPRRTYLPRARTGTPCAGAIKLCATVTVVTLGLLCRDAASVTGTAGHRRRCLRLFSVLKRLSRRGRSVATLESRNRFFRGRAVDVLLGTISVYLTLKGKLIGRMVLPPDELSKMCLCVVGYAQSHWLCRLFSTSHWITGVRSEGMFCW